MKKRQKKEKKVGKEAQKGDVIWAVCGRGVSVVPAEQKCAGAGELRVRRLQFSLLTIIDRKNARQKSR